MTVISHQFQLIVGKKFNQFTYTVANQDKSVSLAEFCEKTAHLPYNTVLAGIHRRGWLITGIYGQEFREMIVSMLKRAYRGSVKCPACAKGRLPAKYSPRGNGKRLVPVVTISWKEQDGSEPVWAQQAEVSNA